MKFKSAYDVFEVVSADPSRLLKAIGKIHIWDVKRKGASLTFKAASADSAMVKKIADKCGIHVEKITRKGAGRLPGFLMARPAVPAGIIAVVVFILFAGGYCFSLDVKGLRDVSGGDVLGYLAETGITFPVKKSEIDRENLESSLFMHFEEFIYVGAEFEGTRLEITVQEGAKIPTLDETAPAEMVASKAGVVVSVDALAGQSAVSIGQRVEAGDILIAGEYVVGEKPMLMSADGSVKAQVIYTGKSEKPVDEHENVMTGNYATARDVSWGNIQFLTAISPFENYEVQTVQEILLGENSPVCVLVKDVVYYEVEESMTVASAFAAEVQAREEAYYKALENIGEGAEIIDVSYNVVHSPNGVIADVFIITEEEIARRRLLDVRAEQSE